MIANNGTRILNKMSNLKKIPQKQLASSKICIQIIGALFQWRWKAFVSFVFFVIPASIGVSVCFSHGDSISILVFITLNLIVWLTIKVCRSLIDVFNLRKNAEGITWCYISILIALVIWAIGVLVVYNIPGNSKSTVAIGIIGSLLTWIFQDRIKGVVTFIHLRMNGLLNIDDRIIVPKYNIDGEVKRISLTTVSIYNRDTSTSTMPISALSSDHFINYQKVADGKTYGRKMSKTLILDTSWFRPLSKEEVDSLITKLSKLENTTPMSDMANASIYYNLQCAEVENGALNAQLYRIYLFHWLMNHKHISQYPRLVVRWKDHEEGGLPLEIYAFITDRNTEAYEYQQSQIIEHAIKSLDWFGLRLFQKPSAFDTNNKNVYVTQEQQLHRKEMPNEL